MRARHVWIAFHQVGETVDHLLQGKSKPIVIRTVHSLP